MRLKVNAQLVKEWEARLRPFGLSEYAIHGQDETEMVIIPAGSTPPTHLCGSDTQ